MSRVYDRIQLDRIVPVRGSLRRQLMATTAVLVVNNWKRLAGQLPVSAESRNEYKRQIRIKSVTETTAEVELYGSSVFPNMLEQGMGPGGVGTVGAYDMRKYYFPVKNGYFKGKHYRAIPFETKRKPTAQRAAAAFANLRPVKTAPGRRTSFAGQQSLPAGLARRTRPRDQVRSDAAGNPYVARRHATDRYAGLYRMQKTYSGKTEYSGVKFRMMSLRGKPWMHPGIPAYRVGRRVLREANNQFNMALQTVMGGR